MLKRFGVVVVMAAMAVAARAQSDEPCSYAGLFSVNYGAGGRSGVGYTAKTKSTFEQNLVDGNRIHGTSRGVIARTGTGVTYQQMAMGCTRGENGQMVAEVRYEVWDPVTKTSTSWTTGSPYDKVVSTFHQADFQVPVVPPPTPEELAERQRAAKARVAERSGYSNEDLGTKTIAGVLAHGRKTTHTIAAGEQGNDSPLVTTQEMWTAEKLGLVMKVISENPRTGRSTYEVEELTVGEPDAALFTPPAEYPVRDMTQTVKMVPAAQ